jgi:hypothetical protein
MAIDADYCAPACGSFALTAHVTSSIGLLGAIAAFQRSDPCGMVVPRSNSYQATFRWSWS